MARIPQSFLVTGIQLGTSATTIVETTSNGTYNIIHSLSFFNTSSTLQETVKIYKYTSGGAADDADLIAEQVILPRKTWNAGVSINKVLSYDQILAASTTTATTVNVECSGIIAT
jgi:hypothetical protein